MKTIFTRCVQLLTVDLRGNRVLSVVKTQSLCHSTRSGFLAKRPIIRYTLINLIYEYNTHTQYITLHKKKFRLLVNKTIEV